MTRTLPSAMTIAGRPVENPPTMREWLDSSQAAEDLRDELRGGSQKLRGTFRNELANGGRVGRSLHTGTMRWARVVFRRAGIEADGLRPRAPRELRDWLRVDAREHRVFGRFVADRGALFAEPNTPAGR